MVKILAGILFFGIFGYLLWLYYRFLHYLSNKKDLTVLAINFFINLLIAGLGGAMLGLGNMQTDPLLNVYLLMLMSLLITPLILFSILDKFGELTGTSDDILNRHKSLLLFIFFTYPLIVVEVAIPLLQVLSSKIHK
jgi:hypothetical protein